MAALNGAGNAVPRWQRIWFDASLIALLATGVTWLVAHYTLGAGRDEFGLPHWSEAWWMRLHGLASFTVLIAIGMFLAGHVPRGWRSRRDRSVEMAMLICLALTIASAFCLYYFVSETARPAIGWLHAATAGFWVAAVVWHRCRERAGRSLSVGAKRKSASSPF